MLITGDMVIGGFISKIINDCGDILKKKIKDADNNRKSYSQNFETRIYQVTIDALNEFTEDKYKGQDTLYDAVESILKEFKCDRDDNTEAVKSGLKVLNSQIAIERCKDFLGALCHEICKDENDVLYKEISMTKQEQMSENMKDGFKNNDRNHEETHRRLDYAIEGIDYIKENLYGQEGGKIENYSKTPVENRAEEYAQKWDKNMFLNDFNEEDEKTGVNIKLRDIYIDECLPHYIWKTNTKPSDGLKNLLKKYIIDNSERKMLLILGQPGIGKSVLITWIMSNLIKKRDDILVYQFASDLKDVDWNGREVLNNIFDVLNLKDRDLNNKTLILDGFDEIDTSGDRNTILNKLSQDLIRMNRLKKFFLMITCRENYIDKLYDERYDYITLQAWNEEQIKSFCKIYEEKSTGKNIEVKNNSIQEAKINKILKNKEIFGVPLILYMVLALDIAIEKSNSVVDVYDQIFSPDGGGIYARCYDVEHRINDPKIKGQIHNIYQRVAFWIFENNAGKAFIPQDDLKKICDSISENIQSDVLIGNYFKLIKHCEGIGTEELHFIHRSIYEYFVAVYFFESIHKLMSKVEVAGKLGELLKDGRLTEQILEFMKYKFDSMKGFDLADITKEVFCIMVRDGMTYHTGVPCLKVIEREFNIFSNMLKVVHLWNVDLGTLNDRIVVYLVNNRECMLNLKGIRLVPINSDIEKIYSKYLKGDDLSKIDMEKVDLSVLELRGAFLCGANLSEADLYGVNLSEANLYGADLQRAVLIAADLPNSDLSFVTLSEADLREVDLGGANLRGADLTGANLEKANLRGADLTGAILVATIFDERQVDILSEKYDLSNSKVYISETGKIITYKEYCMGKQEKGK